MLKSNFLNVLACGCFLTLSLHATSNDDQKKTTDAVTKSSSWKSFTSTQGNFTIDLPSEPQEIEQKIDIPKTDLSIQYMTYLSEPQDNVVYVVSVWTYPPEIDMDRPDINLQDGFGGMLSALPGAEVLFMQMKEVQGFQALEFTVKSEEIYFRGMLLLAHNTLYQIFTVYKEGDKKEHEEMDQNYQHFMGSLRLLHADASPGGEKNTRKLKM